MEEGRLVAFLSLLKPNLKTNIPHRSFKVPRDELLQSSLCFMADVIPLGHFPDVDTKLKRMKSLKPK